MADKRPPEELNEHVVALSRVCTTDDPAEFQASLEFLNDDGWEINRTPRDVDFSKAESVADCDSGDDQ